MFTMAKAKWYMFLMKVEMWYASTLMRALEKLDHQRDYYLSEIKYGHDLEGNEFSVDEKIKLIDKTIMYCKAIEILNGIMKDAGKKLQAKHDKYKAFYNEKLGIDC